MENNANLRFFLLNLRHKYDYALVSDAPVIWINNVLKELDIADLFKNKVFSGEGNLRKGFKNSFQFVADKLSIKPEDCIVIGDQEDTDIIPAKKNNMVAFLVGENKKNTKADSVIRDIFELKKVLKL